MKMILLGPPAAGKGTQSAYLSEYYDIPAISPGSIIRHNISEGTELGVKAKKYIERIEEITKTPIKFIGTGPARENTIVRD